METLLAYLQPGHSILEFLEALLESKVVSGDVNPRWLRKLNLCTKISIEQVQKVEQPVLKKSRS